MLVTVQFLALGWLLQLPERHATRAPVSLLQTSEGRAKTSDNCQWTVHYDLWIKTFDAGEYEPPGSLGGAHCLVACCKDPTCKGLALYSSEMYQCYKYSRLPNDLDKDPSRMLGDGSWLRQEKPAWSIFVKHDPAPISPAHEVETVVNYPALLPPSHLATMDVLGKEQTCDWKVHYDRWVPSFEHGEYEHNNAYGGAHCLVACCQDPTCHGLALESTERYQCYKYSSLPEELQHYRGKLLGNGQWLRDKPQAWSIFVKVPLSVAAADQPGRITSETNHNLSMPLSVIDKSLVARMAILVVGSVVAFHGLGMSSDSRVKRLFAKTGLFKANPETQKLLVSG